MWGAGHLLKPGHSPRRKGIRRTGTSTPVFGDMGVPVFIF